MGYLMETYKIQARLLITIHDEIRYLVKEEDSLRAAFALQISNVWTRAYFAQKCGMDDLPLVCSESPVDAVLIADIVRGILLGGGYRFGPAQGGV